MSKNIGKNLSGNYSQNVLDRVKKSTTDAIKTASREKFKKKQKKHLIGNKITDRTKSVSKELLLKKVP